jgi:N-acetylglucosamine malate deacetylase 1
MKQRKRQASPAAEKVLVVAAHPDDEALGCGGTMALHAERGHAVQAVFLADGVGARSAGRPTPHAVNLRRTAAARASKALGAMAPEFLDFPDNQLDTVPRLSIITEIERIAAAFRPSIVYTHHGGDLNIDHRICHEAVMTAFRPVPGQRVRCILSFEVPSSTSWGSPAGNRPFVPNRFCDIGKTMKAKMRALLEYRAELRPYPHARSARAVEILARHRGSDSGFEMAEAFVVERELMKY